MYKELIITIIIIILIVSLDIITNNYTIEATNRLSSDLENLREVINKKDDKKVQKETEKIINKWKSYNNILSYYIEHDELEKVQTQLTMLNSDKETKKYDDCIKEIDTTVFILNHIEDKEKLTLKSIF